MCDLWISPHHYFGAYEGMESKRGKNYYKRKRAEKKVLFNGGRWKEESKFLAKRLSSAEQLLPMGEMLLLSPSPHF